MDASSRKRDSSSTLGGQWNTFLPEWTRRLSESVPGPEVSPEPGGGHHQSDGGPWCRFLCLATGDADGVLPVIGPVGGEGVPAEKSPLRPELLWESESGEGRRRRVRRVRVAMGLRGSEGALAGASFFFLFLAGAAAGPPGPFFVFQTRAECHFAASNGTQAETETETVRFLQRYIYNRQEIARFDSALGRFVALDPMAQSNVDRFNKDQVQLQAMMARVELCRHNYGIFQPFALRRRIPPKLKITPVEYDSSSNNMKLNCSVDDFFPIEIKITWFRNGKKEEGPQVMTFLNGDWTYGIQVTLETKPERGDVYTCQVEHASFTSPASVQWEPQSDSARSKMWTGVVGILLGVVFVAAGLSFYLRNKKGRTLPQTTVGLMD